MNQPGWRGMALDLKDRQTWLRIGYALSAVWMLGVVIVSGGNPKHPAFDYIFIVPLAGWVLGLIVARFIWPGKKEPD